jgi:hypothetical protein
MKEKSKRRLGIVIIVAIFLLAVVKVMAVPTSPTITTISNSTKGSSSGQIVNSSGNDTQYPNKAGGFIFTINLEGISQNNRWKAYVGNVSGKLTLDDANDYTIYDWTMTTSISGEVYATRTSGSINWASINCSNTTTLSAEEIAMNHTSNPSDNITRTFNETSHNEFYVGDIRIPVSQCPSTNLYVNDTRGISDDFEEIVLYDGTNIVYSTIMEQDTRGYSNATYDFQMILPEMGTSGWSSSTPYYFFVELS